MGATRTYKYTQKDYKEELARVFRVLAAMNAIEISDWVQTVSVLHHMNSEKQLNMYIVTYPTYQIAVISSLQTRQIIQGDNNLSRLISNIQCLKTRQVYDITGKILKIGDFVFKVGIGSIATDPRCLVIEIEFIGTKYISQAGPAIKEFMTLLNPFEKYSVIDIDYSEYFLLNSEEFSQKISAIDLLICLNCLDLT